MIRSVSCGPGHARSGYLSAPWSWCGPGASSVFAQTDALPSVRAGTLVDALRIDGVLDDPGWETAEVIDAFIQADPAEGAVASARTTVRVLAGPRALVIGIACDDPDPAGIVSFSVRRDARLDFEDHVRIVLGPFLDGRSGYVFAVNPSGARYDGLVEPGGERHNPDWDGIWEAATIRHAGGWNAEIRVPVNTLSFKPGLTAWHFNVQRRIQRLLETDRWASPARQYQVTQRSRAGTLTGLPDFSLGLGLGVRPAVTTGGGMPAPSAGVGGSFQPSLDVTQRFGSNLLASVTINTAVKTSPRGREQFVKRTLGLQRRDVDTDSARSRCGRSHSAGAPVRRGHCLYCRRSR
jgi:hypothetical protein